MTVEALRLFALVDAVERPRQLTGAVRTLLGAWRNRTKEKPCMFGHGKRFIDGKWPPTWYAASAVLEALAPYPSILEGQERLGRRLLGARQREQVTAMVVRLLDVTSLDLPLIEAAQEARLPREAAMAH